MHNLWKFLTPVAIAITLAIVATMGMGEPDHPAKLSPQASGAMASAENLPKETVVLGAGDPRTDPCSIEVYASVVSDLQEMGIDRWIAACEDAMLEMSQEGIKPEQPVDRVPDAPAPKGGDVIKVIQPEVVIQAEQKEREKQSFEAWAAAAGSMGLVASASAPPAAPKAAPEDAGAKSSAR